MTPYQKIAKTQGATLGSLTMSWVIEDDSITCKSLIREGRQLLAQVADRYEFVILSDEWAVDGPTLRVTGDVLWWPAGSPALALVDDLPDQELTKRPARHALKAV